LFLSQKLTARQAEKRFGRANLGAKTLEALDENDPDTEFEFIRVCQPRFERDLRRADNANLPFSAIDIRSLFRPFLTILLWAAALVVFFAVTGGRLEKWIIQAGEFGDIIRYMIFSMYFSASTATVW
jgi:hypothetical protein